MLIETFEERLNKIVTEYFGEETSYNYDIIVENELNEENKIIYSYTISIMCSNSKTHKTYIKLVITGNSYSELFDRTIRMIRAWMPVTRTRISKEDENKTIASEESTLIGE